MKRIRRLLVPATILSAGCVIAALLAFEGEEDLPSVAVALPPAVDTVEVRRMDYRLSIPAWGVVEACETVEIRSEVAGRIVDVPPNRHAGAGVRSGDLLFEVDGRDYLHALEEAQAEHQQSRQQLLLEHGRQKVARAEWEMLGSGHPDDPDGKALALREPQLREREAAVAIAAAREAQARLEHERTRVTAPCNGVIVSESVAEGGLLDRGELAMTLACTDAYHVTALYPPSYSVPAGEAPVTVKIEGREYPGVVKSVMPQVCPRTRHKQVLVELKAEGLPLGVHAEVMLPGRSYGNAIVIPVEALRPGPSVWLLRPEKTLDIRPVRLAAKDPRHAVLAEGVGEGERVIVSHVPTPLGGMALSEVGCEAEERE